MSFSIIVTILAVVIASILLGWSMKKVDDYLYFKFNGLPADRYIVLKCVIPNPIDEGGFAWHLHQVQCLLFLAKATSKIPIIYFNRGYYYQPKYGDNWYNYYFQPIADPVLTRQIVNYGEKYGYKEITKYPLQPTYLPYLYTMDTFQDFMRRIPNIDFHWAYQFIIPNQKMQTRLDNFTKTHFGDHYLIGIHYRGTDKFPNHGSNEDQREPKHASYYEVVIRVRDYLNQHPLLNPVIFVASDEEPFVDTIKLHFKNVVSYISSRSSANTSRLELPSQECDKDSTAPVCQHFNNLKRASIHRGTNPISPYKKGQDAVMDIWLLAKCQVLFLTQTSNFSNQPQRINNRLKIIKIN